MFNGGDLNAAIPTRPAGINPWDFGNRLTVDMFQQVRDNRLVAEISRVHGNMSPDDVKNRDSFVASTTGRSTTRGNSIV